MDKAVASEMMEHILAIRAHLDAMQEKLAEMDRIFDSVEATIAEMSLELAGFEERRRNRRVPPWESP